MIGLAVLEKKMFENNGHIHVYNPGAGTDNPIGSICSGGGNSTMILVQVCGWKFFKAPPIHIYRFSKKDTYSYIRHMKLLNLYT